jgi:hypothetical protein
LVAASNRADANLKESGHQVNPGDAKEVNDAQRRLRDDIVLGLSNGLTLDQIRHEYIEPAVEKEGGASEGTRMAIDHVLGWVNAYQRGEAG